jgi:hypothetical protein
MATHKDLEFHVNWEQTTNIAVFKTFKEAAEHAFVLAASNGGQVTLDVITWSEGAAKAWGGDSAVEAYREDPDASVFERFEVKVNSLGRVP